MVGFINKITGSEMRVAEGRAKEYRAAGHRPVESVPVSTDEPRPKRPARKAKK